MKRRKLERKWRKDKLVVHREIHVDQCVRVNKLIHDTKMRFYANIIDENTMNQIVLFSSIGRMLNLKADKKNYHLITTTVNSQTRLLTILI